jgi:hypothetical protein
MVLTAYSALSPVIGLSCHRRRRNCFHRLDAGVEASGPHDFAVREKRSRRQRCRVHRIPPRVRDDRDTPLDWGETAGVLELIWGKREGKYFWKWGWTAQIRLMRFNKSQKFGSGFCGRAEGVRGVAATVAKREKESQSLC